MCENAAAKAIILKLFDYWNSMLPQYKR